MNIQILKEALAMYAAICLDDKDKSKEIERAQAEVSNCDALMDQRDVWKDEVHIVSMATACDIGNQATYDIFGKLQRKAGADRIPFEDFYNEALNYIDELTVDFASTAYDVVADLWFDNEADGCHNPDGTFNQNLDDDYTVIHG